MVQAGEGVEPETAWDIAVPSGGAPVSNLAGGTRGLVLRVVLAVLLLGYAVVTVVSGVGRISTLDSRVVGPMNWPYDTMAARRAADDALAAKNPRLAEAMAARALLSDPVDPAVVGRLGWARMMQGNVAGADAAFRVSATMGWRDPFTQAYWIGQSLQLGQPDMAAQRMDALLRQSPGLDARDHLFAAVGATPQGRAALARQMTSHPGWTPAFLTPPAEISAQDLANRLDVIGQVPGQALDCPAMAGMVNALVAASMVAQAEAIWRKACGASDALIYDGRFAHFDVTAQGGTRAFDWQVASRGDVSLTLTPLDATSRELEVRVSGAISRPVLRQVLVLRPGRYRLTWTMPDLSVTQAAMVRVGLGCNLGRGAAEPGQLLGEQARGGGASSRYARDVVVDGACQAQGLIFWVEPGVDVRLSDVQLVRTGG